MPETMYFYDITLQKQKRKKKIHRIKIVLGKETFNMRVVARES